MDTLLMNIDEASQILNLGRSKVYELVMRGELQSIKIGRSRRIPRSSIEEFIQSRLGPPEASEWNKAR